VLGAAVRDGGGHQQSEWPRSSPTLPQQVADFFVDKATPFL
jgi:hypothetical protein